MREYIIITDSCCDLKREYIESKNIPFVSLTCSYGGKEYKDDFGMTLSSKELFDSMRKGETPKTSQPNSEEFYREFKKIAEQGKDILYICVSSGLSGTYNSANIAKDNILEEFPQIQIEIIDILTASLGQGLMVMKAVEMKEKGSTMEDIVTFLHENIQHLNTYITVDDLNHLKRGGRISTAAAVVGSLLHVKPILSINSEGKVLSVLKAKGRKNSFNILVDTVCERIENSEEQEIGISHADSLPEAEKLKEMILSRIKVKNIIINDIGPVVGCHGGPGAIAVFFFGKKRHHIPIS